MPPDLKVEGDKRRSVKVGEPLTLVALASDPDNLPARRDGKPQPGGTGAQPSAVRAAPASPGEPGQRSLSTAFVDRSRRAGPACGCRGSSTGARPPRSTFSPDQMKTWTDTRAYANSPWSPPFTIPEPPPDGKWVVQATFQEPGTYVLRAVAGDGALFTYENVTVTVTR